MLFFLSCFGVTILIKFRKETDIALLLTERSDKNPKENQPKAGKVQRPVLLLTIAHHTFSRPFLAE